MHPSPVTREDRRRKQRMIVFQIVVYGYLLTMFLIQMFMYMNRDW
jgi:hypothetical protein